MAEQTDTKTTGFKRYLPIAEWLPGYDKSWLRGDTVAAFTVWALLVPEAMAYATLAGVPPEAGLYAAPLALAGYAIFGTSRQLDVGPSSTVAVMSAAVVTPVAAGDPERFIQLTALLAIVVGVIFIVAGLLRLGFVADFMSKPVLAGFIIGLALTIASGQLHKLFGIEVESGNFFEDIWEVLSNLNETVEATLVIGAASLALLFAMHRFTPKLPAALTVTFLSILVVSLFDLDAEGVAIIGEIPAGLPPLGFPDIQLGDVADLIPGALGIVIVGFAESIAAARSYATKYKYEIDADQELIALGAANAGAGFSQGFVVDGSLSKSAASDQAGTKSQMTSIILAVLVLVTAVALTPLFENLAEATLGAIVIHAVWGLIRPLKLRRFYDINQDDFWPALAAMLGVLLFDILAGLAFAVILSLVILVAHVSRPHTTILGRLTVTVAGREIDVYRSVAQYPDEAKTVPGLLIFRFDSELFFANSTVFKEDVRAALAVADPQPEVILVDAEAITDIDLTSLDTLGELREELSDEGIELWFARVHASVAELMDRYGLADEIGPDRFYLSVEAGAEAFGARRR